jgi:ParB family transcriptional regulator, chromosome partitioning protein
MGKRNALGKGLGALLESSDTDITSGKVHYSPNSVAMIAISQIIANPFQPREKFETDSLNELMESIEIHGVIQPITVRKAGFEKFEIISGERRTRASILAGLTEIPAYIRLANDQEMLEMALIENIQREDLNAIEISLSYKRLQDECGLKQEELGERVGKKRSTVNNYLRLQKLPDKIQVAIQNRDISMGHARALISIDDAEYQNDLFTEILRKSLSVRQVEALVKKSRSTSGEKKTKEAFFDFTEFLPQKSEISEKLGSKLEYRSTKGESGNILIKFKGKEQLQSILDKLNSLEG